MIAQDSPHTPTLSQVLSARAQHASSARLILDITVGVTVSAAALIARPKGWVALLAAALCFLSFGTWAATARRLHTPQALVHDAEDQSVAATGPQATYQPLWLLLHVTSALAGLAAFVLLLFSTLALSLGKIIS